jgi:fused signal recognition particle receptor
MLGWFKKKFSKKGDEIPGEPLESPTPLVVEEEIVSSVTENEAIPAIVEAINEETVAISIKDEETSREQASHAITPLEEKAKSPSLFKRLAEKLSKTREAFTYQLDSLFLGRKEIDAKLFDDLEELLITADLGVATTREILDHARRKVSRKELSDPESLKIALKEKIKSFITDYQRDAELVVPESGPFVIMVVGVNGVGKTTTIGKIAHKFVKAGNSVMLVAGDTFRAAAVSQLQIWGERNKVHVVARADGADPSSVVYDAMDIARSNDYDVVLVDTAGRLHTQANLMEELKKIKRVMGKRLEGAPHEVMLVIDATTGQNGISQAKLFHEAVGLTGITLTKLDGTAKGGIVANICRELQTPIRFIGVGEKVEDLRDFDPDEFIEALFESRTPQGKS